MALQDKIGREVLVDKICGLVDSLKKDSNFCLAINGAWGSGKSFVLGLIEERLSKKKEYIIIKYDAWENTFYSDPLLAILSCVIDGIEGKLYLVERREETVRKVAKAGVDTLAKLSAKIAKLKTAIDGIKDIIKSFHNPIDTAALSDFKSYQRLLKDTKEILNELTQAGEYRQRQTKLIILVDEIDRCLPDEQLKILERLHHLFEVKNCAVIVTMNQACVAKIVQTVYGIDGYEYLRKFFNFTYKLETSASGYLKSLLADFKKNFEKFQAAANEVMRSVELAYQFLLYGSEKLLNKVDNRELTRYYEGVINVCNDFGWQNINEYHVFFILIAFYVRKIISPTFLNADELIANQRQAYEHYDTLSSEQKSYIMPFFDYIKKYLGVDRMEIPDELSREYYGTGIVLEFSWVFNEAICYISGQRYWGRFYGYNNQPKILPEDSKELCRLIILYGGEQEHARDER